MHIITPSSILRKWSYADIPSLVFHANNPEIAKWMRDGFPYPYTDVDADRFITMATKEENGIILAIEVDGMAVGGIGTHQLCDIYRKTSEIGYWLSKEYQGKGIISDAVLALIPVAFEHQDIIRIQAGVFHSNLASRRVLEKCGFTLESIREKAIFKNDEFLDEYMYVLFRSEYERRKEPII